MRARKLRSNFFKKKSTNSFISKMDSVFFPRASKNWNLKFWGKIHPILSWDNLSQTISTYLRAPLPPSHSPSQTPLQIILNPTPSQPILTHYHLEPSPPHLSRTIPTYTEPSQNIPNYPEPSPPIQNHPHLYWTIPKYPKLSQTIPPYPKLWWPLHPRAPPHTYP